VGPDNGLLSLLPDGEWWEILVQEPLASRTFHGRDLFAPVAAKLAAGQEPGQLGYPVSDPQRLSLPEAKDGEGEILYFDGYGNAITSLRGIDVGEVEVGDRRLPVFLSYGAVAPGVALALTGSTGRLELAVRNGSAQAELALEVGMLVRVHAWK
jgi:S-adenosylmethionine hydrolase